MARSTKTRLRFDPESDVQPSWSPSGRDALYENRADDASEPATLASDETTLVNPVLLAAGKYLFHQRSPGGKADIVYSTIQADGAISEPIRFPDSPASESVPRLSPDGVASWLRDRGR